MSDWVVGNTLDRVIVTTDKQIKEKMMEEYRLCTVV